MMMNIGNIDRILRVVVGLVLVGLTLIGSIGPWGWLGLALVATAAFGFCPAYSFLGINTWIKK